MAAAVTGAAVSAAADTFSVFPAFSHIAEGQEQPEKQGGKDDDIAQ